MGLPTTASYIVVSSLLAPVIVNIGAQNGLPVPLIAAHLFVFYFGLMADITPPVGLASYAAASIAYANPIRTGVVAFKYSMRMVLLPFMFVLNPQLLLIGVNGVFHTVITVSSATLAGLAFISVNQGWLLVRSTLAERLVLLLTVFMLFYPGLFMDRLFAPYRQLRGDAAEAAIEAAPKGAQMRIFMSGTTLEGDAVEREVLLPLDVPAPSATQRLINSGVDNLRNAEGFAVTGIAFSSPAARLGIEPGFQITAVEVPSGRPPSEWMIVPALGLIGWVVVRQRRRRAAATAGVLNAP